MSTAFRRSDVTATTTHPAALGRVTSAPVQVSGGDITLDALAIPYAQGSVDVPYVDGTVLEDLDPREDVRVTVVGTDAETGTSRTFNLGLRSREVVYDVGQKVIRGEVASDEALLTDYATLTKDSSAFAYQSSLRGVCNYVLAKATGAINPTPVPPPDLTGWGTQTQAGTLTLAYVSPGQAKATIATGAPTYFGLRTDGAPVVPGKTYSMRAVITASKSTTLLARIEWYDSSNVYMSAAPTWTAVGSSGVALPAPSVAPAGAAFGRMVIRVNAAEAIGTWIACSYAAFAEGSSPPAALDPTPSNDADVTTYSDATNRLTNPSAIVDLTGWVVAGGAAILRQTGVAAMANTAKTAFRINGNASGNATFIETTLSSPPSGRLRFQARQLNGGTALTGAQNASYLNMTVMVSVNGGATYTYYSTTPGPTAANGTKDHVLYLDVPANVTTVKIRLIHGVTTAAVLYWGDVMVTDDNGDPGDVAYWDGSSTDTATYLYDWQGAVGASQSIRTALVDRPPDLLIWLPGTTAWDFLEPLVTAAGLRLFCDEARVWRLINPFVYAVTGLVTVSADTAASASDVISRDDVEYFCTGVVVEYAWTDPKTGTSFVQYDVAGTPSKVFVQRYASPYPGPGAAAAILKRRNGTGHIQNGTTLVVWTATPAMSATVSLPGASTQQGAVVAIRFGLDDDALMDVTTGGLVEKPPGSIDLLVGTIDALVGTIDSLNPTI